jgi:hypothetical protein
MINREHNLTDAIEKIKLALRSNKDSYHGFRVRSVLAKGRDNWSAICCVVQAIVDADDKVEKIESRHYPEAILHEDWLSTKALLKFISRVDAGEIVLDDYTVSAEPHQQWNRVQVPLKNDYMDRAGQVFSNYFNRNLANTSYVTLWAPGQPYYPDIADAARDWLPFPVYHGNSDARNGEVVILLPETRAFFQGFSGENETIEVRVSGALSKSDSLLLLKGAWWEENKINHFEAPVVESVAKLSIPTYATRVEVMLTDNDGTVYDYLRSDNFRFQGISGDESYAKDEGIAKIVIDACESGEGRQIEFKPFIELGGKRNEKLAEIARTVSAFANTKGGRIFLGINNDCELMGINSQLSEWASGESSSGICDKYLGALRSKIKDVIVGEPEMLFRYTEVRGMVIAVIEVSEAREKPTYIHQDHYLYVRRGSSNKKAAPEEWKAIICTQEKRWD